VRERNSEAARLERDYLERLRAALAGREPGEAEEIVGAVREHVEEALAEDAEGEVTLVRMANVLERLGPPEAWAGEGSPTPAAEPAPAGQPPAAAAPAASPAFPAAERQEAATLLDKVWWAYFVSVLGLFVPLIDLHFCDIIGYAMLGYLLGRVPRDRSGELRGAGTLSLVAVVLLVLMVPFSALSLLHSAFAIPGLPILLGLFVCQLIVYWKVLEGAALLVQRAGRDGLAGEIRSVRVIYIVLCCALLVVGLVAGVALVAAGVKHAAEIWWLGFLTLPLGWLFGWLFVLRPLGWARDALREESGVEPGGPERLNPLTAPPGSPAGPASRPGGGGWKWILGCGFLFVAAAVLGGALLVFSLIPYRKFSASATGIGSGDPVPPQLLGTWVFSRPDDPSTELELTFRLQGGCQVRERNGSSTSGWTSSYRVSGHEVTVDKMRFILSDGRLCTEDGTRLQRKGETRPPAGAADPPPQPPTPEAEPEGAAQAVPAGRATP
jgi:hypothetical protein